MIVAFALKVLAFLHPYLKPIAGVLLVLATLAALLFVVHHKGYQSGVKAKEAEYAKALAKAEKRVKVGEKRSAAISAKVEAEHVRTVEKIRTVTQTIVKEIPYAVPTDPARPSLGFGFVRLHDAAAIGVPSLPNPAGRSDAEASGVTDTDLARTVIANYEACRVNAETVMAWQSWVADQAASYNATTGQKP